MVDVTMSYVMGWGIPSALLEEAKTSTGVSYDVINVDKVIPLLLDILNYNEIDIELLLDGDSWFLAMYEQVNSLRFSGDVNDITDALRLWLNQIQYEIISYADSK